MILLDSGTVKSHSSDCLRIDTLGFEKPFGKVDYGLRVIDLAAKDVKISRVSLIREMRGNQGRLYELGHRISCDPLVFTKMDDLGFTKPFHLDKITKLYNELSDFLRVSDDIRITFV